MKKSIHLSCFLALVLLSLSASSQKYKTADDTARLNKEYNNITKDIADLTAQLGIAEARLPRIETKASDASSDAQKAAESSSDQASKATNGSVKDARSAKRKAKRAYNESKDARSAEGNVDDQQKRIKKLNSQLAKKQERLHELEEMRIAISQASVKP